MTYLVTDADVRSAQDEAAEAQELLRFAERRAELTALTLERRTHLMTILHTIDVAPASLRRIARSLRRNLEATADRHEHAAATLDPQAKAAEMSAVVEEAHSGARAVRTSIIHEIQEAVRLGFSKGDDFDEARKPVDDLVDRILATMTLDDAEKLVASLSE